MIKDFNTAKEKNGLKEVISAEFQLAPSQIFFQFKIRKNAEASMFAVVKEGSRALEALKEGEVIPMTYHFQDKSVPAEKKETRVKYIVNANNMGFKGHYMIGLDINSGIKELNVA
jgi:hypothetical protein